MKVRIQEIREQRGMSRAELAREAGVTWAAVNKWESGKCFPSLIMAARIAKALKCKIDDLITN